MSRIVVRLLVLSAFACASAPDPVSPPGPASIPLEAARSDNPAPIAASAEPPPAPASAARCPLELPGVVVEAEGVPNGIAIVFRKLGAEDRIRALARRFVEELERVAEPPDDELVTGRVRARVDYADAPDGAMVTFVPEDLDFELDHVDAVIESVRRSADEMRETRRCTAPDGVAIVGA